LKITQKQQQAFQWLCIFALISLVGYTFFVFPVNNPLSFFKKSEFVQITLGLSVVYMVYNVISGNSKRFPIKIIDSVSIENKVHYKSNPVNVTRFGFIGYGLSLAFTVMVMIFLGVALSSGTGRTVIHWNAFGEMYIEAILFSICFVVIIIGFILTYKNLKQSFKK
jgi:hypothetical protein